MKYFKKSDIKNLHYNHNNEIEFQYYTQKFHYSMIDIINLIVDNWNLLNEIKNLKARIVYLETSNNKKQETIDKAISYLEKPNRDSFDFSKATLIELLKEGKINNKKK